MVVKHIGLSLLAAYSLDFAREVTKKELKRERQIGERGGAKTKRRSRLKE